jgi:hypothetical protein
VTPAEIHTAILADLADLTQLAEAAQPGGAWYQEGRDVNTTMPLLSPAEMAALHPDEFEDWVFTAATKADAAFLAAQQPRAVIAQLAGRRRTLERHAPFVRLPPWGQQPYCEHHYQHEATNAGAEWPCDDYRDAAADLLPEGT